MRSVDVAIVGGGAAGSAAAAMLGRAGIDAALIDPHDVYPPDFRCEKLDRSQMKLLERSGLSDVLDVATPGQTVRVARGGQVVRTIQGVTTGILYDTLVNRIRAEIPVRTPIVRATATDIATSGDRQRIALSTGEEIDARLVVMANGLNARLLRSLGIERLELSRCHSVSIGFDLVPLGRGDFDFSALTYYPHRLADRMAYLTLFRVATGLRANLFVYWGASDPRLRGLRQRPERVLSELMPSLADLIGPYALASAVKVRPIDLTASAGNRRPGMVLIGDAFATSCPAAGTGMNKVLTDVERLCGLHLPRWLATPGMEETKIAAFYDDPVKQACDRWSALRAFQLRSISTDPGLLWGALRAARLLKQTGMDVMRRIGERLGQTASSQQTRLHPGGG